MKKLCLALLLVVGCKSSSSTGSQPTPQGPPPSTEPAPMEPAPAEPAPAPTQPPDTTQTEPAPPPTPGSQTKPITFKLGAPCGDGDRCDGGLECVKYYGIAGARGPQFKTCERRCDAKKSCPSGERCQTIADGPGQVCRP